MGVMTALIVGSVGYVGLRLLGSFLSFSSGDMADMDGFRFAFTSKRSEFVSAFRFGASNFAVGWFLLLHFISAYEEILRDEFVSAIHFWMIQCNQC